MRLIESSYEILTDLSNPLSLLKSIELAARTCYKSEDKITEDSCIQFCKMLASKNHGAMLEHADLSVLFTIDRAIANELVRHRLCSFAQSSTRYCNYSKGKFGNEITVVVPECLKSEESLGLYNVWYNSCEESENSYMEMIRLGAKPEIARNVLPLSTATDIVVKANIREWRNIFELRTTMYAHPQMRSIMNKLLKDLQSRIPVLFDGIGPDSSKNNNNSSTDKKFETPSQLLNEVFSHLDKT